MPEQNALYFDLYKELTTNPDFANKMEKEFKAVLLADKSGDVQARNFHLMNAIRACDYNMSLFVPYFFPDFVRGKPMTLWSRPHAMAMMAMAPNSSVTIAASRQIGKCCCINELLRLKDTKTGVETTSSIGGLFEEVKASHATTSQCHKRGASDARRSKSHKNQA